MLKAFIVTICVDVYLYLTGPLYIPWVLEQFSWENLWHQPLNQCYDSLLDFFDKKVDYSIFYQANLNLVLHLGFSFPKNFLHPTLMVSKLNVLTAEHNLVDWRWDQSSWKRMTFWKCFMVLKTCSTLKCVLKSSIFCP